MRWLHAFLLLLALAGCASLPPPAPLPRSEAVRADGDTGLGRTAVRSLPPEASGFRLIPEAATALNARLALARHAERSIDAQYYILQDDPMGLLFLSALRDAARRGVRVRLLVDDLYAGDKYPLFAALAREPNFELRLFNPLPARGGGLLTRLVFSLGELKRINHRMHNKLFVADNRWAILGGRNIAAEYFMGDHKANFIDLDVLAGGPVVGELSASFDEYWNSDEVRGVPDVGAAGSADAALARSLVSAPSERDPDLLGNPSIARELRAGRVTLVPGSVQVLVDLPEKIQRKTAAARFAGSVTEQTIAALAGARQEVVLVSPYFIPGEKGLEVLRANAARGVNTVVFTNSLEATDETLVFAGYARYRRQLLKLGVHLYELGASLSGQDHELGDFGRSHGRLHAKAALIDRRYLFIGSMNLDSRSSRQNTEIGLIVDSPELAAQFSRLSSVRLMGSFEVRASRDEDRLQWVAQDADGKEIVRMDEPGNNPLIMLKNWLLTRFIGEEQL